MIIPLTISYLVLLGAAAPVADDQAHPIRFRNGQSSAIHFTAGTSTRSTARKHSEDAKNAYRRHESADREACPLYGHFSRDQPDGRFRLLRLSSRAPVPLSLVCRILQGPSPQAGARFPLVHAGSSTNASTDLIQVASTTTETALTPLCSTSRLPTHDWAHGRAVLTRLKAITCWIRRHSVSFMSSKCRLRPLWRGRAEALANNNVAT
jgi:hypothetical protein